jgi:hypothetical protein
MALKERVLERPLFFLEHLGLGQTLPEIPVLRADPGNIHQ